MTTNSLGTETDSGARELPVTEARNHMAELVDYVDDGGYFYLTRRGRRVAALMPADVAENYEAIEDAYWARRAEEARTGNTMSWDEAITEIEGRVA